MKAETIQTKQSVWNKMIHASFRKVVAFDLLFMGLGAVLGAFTIAGILLS